MMLNIRHILGFAALLGFTLKEANAQTPVLIKDIRENGGSWSNRIEFTQDAIIPMKNNKLFFFAEDKSSEPVPHLSDGTVAGTARIAPVFATLDHMQAYDAVNNRVFFTGAKDLFSASKADEELYVSDGTTAGTKKVKDIETTVDYGSKPSMLTMFQGKVFFKVNAGPTGLWVSDGTEQGTTQLSTLNIDDIFEYKNKLYFVGRSGSFGAAKLWETDGTINGTTQVTLPSSISNFEGAIVTQNAFYIFDIGKLKKYDLVAKTLTLIQDVAVSGPISAVFTLKGKDYFSTAKYAWGSSTDKNVMYETDGTATGTKAIKTYTNPIMGLPHIAEDFAVFVTRSTTNDAEELLLFDGTAAGTIEVDLNTTSGSFPEHFCRAGNRIYFTANYKTAAKDYGRELMVTDGTVAGTKIVADFIDGANASNPRNTAFTKLNGTPTLLFFATIDANGNEPYKMEIPLVTPTREQQATQNLFTLFPNPTQGQFHVITSTDMTGGLLQIVDIQGRIVYQGGLTNNGITINQHFDKGVYFVKLTNNEQQYQVRKLVVME